MSVDFNNNILGSESIDSDDIGDSLDENDGQSKVEDIIFLSHNRLRDDAEIFFEEEINNVDFLLKHFTVRSGPRRLRNFENNIMYKFAKYDNPKSKFFVFSESDAIAYPKMNIAALREATFRSYKTTKDLHFKDFIIDIVQFLSEVCGIFIVPVTSDFFNTDVYVDYLMTCHACGAFALWSDFELDNVKRIENFRYLCFDNDFEKLTYMEKCCRTHKYIMRKSSVIFCRFLFETTDWLPEMEKGVVAQYKSNDVSNIYASDFAAVNEVKMNMDSIDFEWRLIRRCHVPDDLL